MKRYTPTPVGKTVFVLPVQLKVAVHPHACGENGDAALRVYDADGTPPRLWGKLFGAISTNFWKKATPPRLWGKRTRGIRLSPRWRYTPTPVGKTLPVDTLYGNPTVHPHACGENVSSEIVVDTETGTPPRLWGKHQLHYVAITQHRYTPTPVGKTASDAHDPPSVSVHPHACGENAAVDQPLSTKKRYTPTPVGKTRVAALQWLGIRYTPTPVGKTHWHSSAISSMTGTPPRLWGKRIRTTIGIGTDWYTPTPVGKTVLNCFIAHLPYGTPPRLWGKRRS